MERTKGKLIRISHGLHHLLSMIKVQHGHRSFDAVIRKLLDSELKRQLEVINYEIQNKSKKENQ